MLDVSEISGRRGRGRSKVAEVICSNRIEVGGECRALWEVDEDGRVRCRLGELVIRYFRPL